MSNILIDKATVKLALEALGKCRYRALADEIVDPAITALQKALAEQPARQCKWPTCQSEEYQQALAEQIKRELVGEHPAVLAGYEHHEYRPYGAPGEVRIHAILASQYKMPDGTIAEDFEWLADSYRDNKNTIKLIPLYTIKETT